MRLNQDSEILVECGPSHLPSRPAILSRQQQHSPPHEQQQLFDHRKDDPVCFSNNQTANPLATIFRGLRFRLIDIIICAVDSVIQLHPLYRRFIRFLGIEGKPCSETTGTILSAPVP